MNNLVLSPLKVAEIFALSKNNLETAGSVTF